MASLSSLTALAGLSPAHGRRGSAELERGFGGRRRRREGWEGSEAPRGAVGGREDERELTLGARLGAVEAVAHRRERARQSAAADRSRERERPGRTHMVWQRYSENGLASFSRRAAVCVSRESATQRYACMRTAGPRYWSWFHQYDGHDVEQHAQRMHCGRRRFCGCQHTAHGERWDREQRSGHARTHLVHAVELEAVLLGLEVLPAVGGLLSLEVRLDRLVLLVEPVREGVRAG